MSAFFSAESWVGAGGINEGDDGESEFFGFAHFGEGFSVAFGVGASEVTREFFLGGLSLLVSDDEALSVSDSSESGDECGVVCEGAVAVEFAEVAGDVLDVVAGLRAVGVTRNTDGVPGREVGVDILEHLDSSFFEELDVVWIGFEVLCVDASERGDFDAWGFDGFAGEFDLVLDRGDWFFELKLVESGHMCFLLWSGLLYGSWVRYGDADTPDSTSLHRRGQYGPCDHRRRSAGRGARSQTRRCAGSQCGSEIDVRGQL